MSIFKHLLCRVQASPTLDLARDYSRFVIAFFELISASAPHIYISALPLSPPTSMVHKMYKQYTCPLVRDVHGLQTSWDPVVAAVYDKHFSDVVVWSPCNRFIAVTKFGEVEVRDAITLNLLSNFGPSSDARTLSFSPDCRFITQFDRGTMVTWDLQTGVSAITTSPEWLFVKRRDFSPAYSMDGKMVAGEYSEVGSDDTFIVTHDFSTTRTHSYRVSEGHLVSPLWTHSEFLRFATLKSGYITIWQVESTFTHPPEVVESLPTPDEVIEREASAVCLFLPTISRLAIALEDTLLVWDARDLKRPLKISDSSPFGMSFSSDGHFFACALRDEGIYIWKESTGGYILHRKLIIDFGGCPLPLLSPNGESIILAGNSTIRLLHTEDPFLSSHPTLAIDQPEFVLNFSPNEASAAFTRCNKNVVTILDLQSDNPQLEIDTGMEVEWLGVTGNAVFAANQQKIVTRKLATRNTRANVHDSVQITTLALPPSLRGKRRYFMSVFPDLSRIVTLASGPVGGLLAIFDVSTGRCLAGPTLAQGALEPRARFKATDINVHADAETVWSTPDGREIWGAPYSDSPSCGWEVIEDRESGTTRLQPLEMTACPPGALPWLSSRGYEVTYDGWILSPTQRRLLWLPHRWRSVERDRKWEGRFLGLFHRGLPEVVILEFLD